MTRRNETLSIEEWYELRKRFREELEKGLVFPSVSDFAKHMGTTMQNTERILKDNSGELGDMLVLVDQQEELCKTINAAMSYIHKAKEGIEALEQMRSIQDQLAALRRDAKNTAKTKTKLNQELRAMEKLVSDHVMPYRELVQDLIKKDTETQRMVKANDSKVAVLDSHVAKLMDRMNTLEESKE